jgi:hypothetical protein
VRGEDPDSEPRRVRPGGSGNGSVDPRNWWFAAYHSSLIHHTDERPHRPLASSTRPVTTLVGFSSCTEPCTATLKRISTLG